MATTGGAVASLVDVAKRLEPNGRIAKVAELLNQTNDILVDMLWKEGNLATGHVTTVRTGLPAAAWRLMNGGVTPSKSTTAQITEAIGMLEAYGNVDVDLAALNGSSAEFRASEAPAFVEALNQNFAQTLFYGDTTVYPERFLGLAPRYSAIAGATNGVNVLSAGGSGSDNTSVWLIVWGEQTCCGIYPKGGQSGLMHEDLGKQLIQNATGIAGAVMQAYVDHWQWKCGLALKDWRYVVRLCNIDVSDLVGSAGTQNAQQLINLMSRMMDRVPSFAMGRAALYMNRTVFSMLRVQALAKSSAALSINDALDQFGNPIRGGMKFFGIPIYRCDQLLNTEATVV